MRDDAEPGSGHGRRAVRLLQAVRRSGRRAGRVPAGTAGAVHHIKVPQDGADERFVYLSDVLPTAWQGAEYDDVPDGGTLVVRGLGPIGSMACRIAAHRKGCRVIGVDLVEERLGQACEYCTDVIDLRRDDAEDVVLGYTDGAGAQPGDACGALADRLPGSFGLHAGSHRWPRLGRGPDQRQQGRTSAHSGGVTGQPEVEILAPHGLLLAIPAFAPAIAVAGVVIYVALWDRRRGGDTPQGENSDSSRQDGLP
jgi:threonine dehydrogenase-like Zn-dependent dehydrogenase